MSKQFYYPLLDTFMRALPYIYRNIEAAEETLLKFAVTGEGGGNWYLYRQDFRWQLLTEAAAMPHTQVTIPGEIAWLLFTKAIPPAVARKKVTIQGSQELGEPILHMVVVMA